MPDAHKVSAAIYVRISRDAREEGLGVARQRADCEALAARLGWNVAKVYEDNDVSASKGKPRPAYEAMRAAITSGRVNAVIVWDVDRLTRSPRELEDVIDWADKLGLRLASVGGDIDLGTEQGRMLARMKGTVARYEVEQASRRLKRKHRELAEAGRPNGPRAYGWDRVRETTDDGREVTAERVNLAEAAIVQEAARRILEGEALWRIVGDLNARGVTTSTGAPWRPGTLRTVLLRTRNVGDRTHHGVVVSKDAFPPILDRHTYERVVATLTDPARRSNNRGTEVKYLLTSKARCGVCGGYLVGKKGYTYRLKNGRDRNYRPSYICQNRGCMKITRDMELVDAVAEGVIVGVLERDGVRALGGDPAAVDEASARIDALDAKLALAADQFADDVITGEQLQRITGRLRPQIEAEKKRRRDALPSSELENLVGPGAGATWARLDVERRRAVIDALGIIVTVLPVGAGNKGKAGPESVKIEWRSEA